MKPSNLHNKIVRYPGNKKSSDHLYLIQDKGWIEGKNKHELIYSRIYPTDRAYTGEYKVETKALLDDRAQGRMEVVLDLKKALREVLDGVNDDE